MMKLVGLNPYDFEKDGERVQGMSCHLINDMPDSDRLLGVETVKFSMSPERFSRFLSGRQLTDVLNTEVEVTYNRYGKVASMVSVAN